MTIKEDDGTLETVQIVTECHFDLIYECNDDTTIICWITRLTSRMKPKIDSIC